MTTRRNRIEAIKKDLATAHELVEAGEAERAGKKYREVLAAMKPLGLESAYVLFCRAELLSRATNTRDLERGFELCCQAVQRDPIHPAHLELFVEYAQLLRSRLDFHSRFPRQPHAPRLYATLTRAGEADAGCHVAMARYRAAGGCTAAAMKLLQGTVLLEPSRADAWALLGELARGNGDEATAAECEQRVKALEESDAPYGVPSPGVVC